jgi:hypothetical protein
VRRRNREGEPREVLRRCSSMSLPANPWPAERKRQ